MKILVALTALLAISTAHAQSSQETQNATTQPAAQEAAAHAGQDAHVMKQKKATDEAKDAEKNEQTQDAQQPQQ